MSKDLKSQTRIWINNPKSKNSLDYIKEELADVAYNYINTKFVS